MSSGGFYDFDWEMRALRKRYRSERAPRWLFYTAWALLILLAALAIAF